MRSYHWKEEIPYNTNNLTFHGGSLWLFVDSYHLERGYWDLLEPQKLEKDKLIQYCEKDRLNLQTAQKDQNNSSFHEF